MPIKRNKSTKRHFQLLELMVAAFILLICIAPTMRIFTNIFKEQQEIIRDNKRDEIAHMMHAKFTEELYKRAIPLDDFEDRKHISLEYPELTALLNKYHFKCDGTLSLLDNHKKDKSPVYLYSLDINIEDTLAKKRNEQKSPLSSSNSAKDPSITTYTYLIYIVTASNESEEPKVDENGDKKEVEDDGDDDDVNDEDDDDDDDYDDEEEEEDD